MIHARFLALLPIFLIICLGVVIGRLDNVKVESSKTVVMGFALPATMFAEMSRDLRSKLLEHWHLLLVHGLQPALFRQSSGSTAMRAVSVALPNFTSTAAPLLSVVLGNHKRIQTLARP
jgi:predicted permease